MNTFTKRIHLRRVNTFTKRMEKELHAPDGTFIARASHMHGEPMIPRSDIRAKPSISLDVTRCTLFHSEYDEIPAVKQSNTEEMAISIDAKVSSHIAKLAMAVEYLSNEYCIDVKTMIDNIKNSCDRELSQEEIEKKLIEFACVRQSFEPGEEV